MKKTLFEIFVCMLLMGTLFVVTLDRVSADLWEDDFFYTVSNGEATITGYNGTGGAISIPSLLGGYPTVAIGDNAFYSNNGNLINSVIIPNTVTFIGYSAFALCSALTSVTIGNNVTTIGNFAFDSCLNLTSVTIPNSVTTIGDYAFLFCTSLTSIAIPSRVTTIGQWAFDSCSLLTFITIPDSVTIIGDGAFGYCSSLTSVTIGNNVTTIGGLAFSYCSSLTSVTIPDSITTIGNTAFAFCTSLTAINVSADNLNYASVNGVLYNKTKTTLIQCPGGKAGTFTIPDSVTTIRDYAFQDCSSLTSVTIGNSVRTIGNSAFDNCSNLTSVIIPDSVTTIGYSAFQDCSFLTSVTIPDSVTAIEVFTFGGCSSLTSITIGSGVTTIGSNAFQDCSFLTSVTIPDSVIAIESYTFNSCSSLTSITFRGFVAPTSVGANWIYGTPAGIRGHAYAASNFPAPGGVWNGLTMGMYIPGPPVFGTPSPTNGSTGNLLSYKWSIPINDFEGDLFNWTIECNNGQTNSGIGATNGTKSLSLSGLTYSKNYKIWVNATDSTGSGNYTRKWYTFTTKSSGGGVPPGGGGIPPTENQKPVADLSTGEPYQGFVNSPILFDGSRSNDPDGNITKWFWIFGDNTNGTGKTLQHTYKKAGTYTVILAVTDTEGATNTDTTTCIIKQPNRPPTNPTITGPTSGTKKTIYTYTTVSTDADNDTIQYTFDWGDSLSKSSGFLPNGSSFTINHSWAAVGRYSVIVTATDNQTASSSKITVYIDVVQVGNIGYLFDNNSDGNYDTFHNDTTSQNTLVTKTGSNYLLDSNGDGKWDYTYNATNGLTEYKEKPKTPGFKLVFVLVAIAVSILLWKKKRNK